ncbi:MAG: response regulator [Planctomycetota bacterium]|nr:response regulator [Planctomycetota bacterium]
MPKEKPLTVKQVADQCHVSKVSVLRWIKQGELGSYTTPGGHHRIRREDFRTFVSKYKIPVDEEMLPAKRNKRILIADDDSAIRELVTRVLTKEVKGCEIEVAADGYEAFYLIGKIKPDLVILDIKMPQLDGLEVCRKIRAQPTLKGMKIFIVTGFKKDFPRESIIQTGADACMEKPFDLKDFAREVKTLLQVRE